MKKHKFKKILLLGSGALKIGEAGEFDYSGTQAIKALKEAGTEVVLVNPNIATIQTSEGLADQVYFVPITVPFVEQVIETEKPDGILLSFGGQTALNCGLELYKQGILKKHKVLVVGTPIEAIIATEDREVFAQRLKALNIQVAHGTVATSLSEALEVAERIGYPVMVRAGFALGGGGSGIAKESQQLTQLVSNALSIAPQVVIEESLAGWKEFEYEVVRDHNNNCIVVCTMENMDPVGIHTGESIVVAPAQTLDNHMYYLLRQMAIDIIRDLEIVGECNIQFAVKPGNNIIRVIEVNARLSRSSALASKATGYPLAYIAAKLAIGESLTTIQNKVTGKTTAFFEPALDYVVVKVPRWDLTKFSQTVATIGSEMKSVGEVMAIGRSFEEALQKALRSLADGYKGLIDIDHLRAEKAVLKSKLEFPTTQRVFYIATAYSLGMEQKEIERLTKIDPWFLSKIKDLVQFFRQLVAEGQLTQQGLRQAKQFGFSDLQIAEALGKSEQYIRSLRLRWGIVPVVRRIDTVAGEFPAETNYLYLSYHGEQSDHIVKMIDPVIVLGCGPYAIGTSVEFDWCAVNVVNRLRQQGKQAVVINCNPETVSTDYDVCDCLFFEELTLERILDIVAIIKAPVIVSVGGQVPNNVSLPLSRRGVQILGTDPSHIRKAEDRKEFSHLLDQLGIDQPAWGKAISAQSAYKLALQITYPILIRPSFVLSGQGMSIIDSEQELRGYLKEIRVDFKKNPLQLSHFYSGAKEYDVDAVAQNGTLRAWAISEHIEAAGIHSGDSTMIFPTFMVDESIRLQLVQATKKIVKALSVSGPVNIQFLKHHDGLAVIECNLRASRSMPLVSKASGVNLMHLATDIFLNKQVSTVKELRPNFYTVKVPQFSFNKLRGADPVLKVEMNSTGEVAGMGIEPHEAYLKGLYATGMKIPQQHKVFISLGGPQAKASLLSYCQKLISMGFELYATSGTHTFLKDQGILSVPVGKLSEGIHPNADDLLKNLMVDFLVIIPERQRQVANISEFKQRLSDGYHIRRLAIDVGLPVFATISTARFYIDALQKYRLEDLPVDSYARYRRLDLKHQES